MVEVFSNSPRALSEAQIGLWSTLRSIVANGRGSILGNVWIILSIYSTKFQPEPTILNQDPLDPNLAVVDFTIRCSSCMTPSDLICHRQTLTINLLEVQFLQSLLDYRLITCVYS